jgi:hypothetical protein
VTAQCESTARRFHAEVLCPSVLPKATVSVPRRFANLRRLRVIVYHAQGAGFAGLSFMYDAEPPGKPPSGFLHFELDPRNLAYNSYPKGRPSCDSRWTRLGGRPGWLRPADGKGAYFGDHVRFFFAVGKTKWVASLHSFGRATTPLLARLVRQLKTVTPSGASKNLRR